jgi:hypothetical protein
MHVFAAQSRLPATIFETKDFSFTRPHLLILAVWRYLLQVCMYVTKRRLASGADTPEWIQTCFKLIAVISNIYYIQTKNSCMYLVLM